MTDEQKESYRSYQRQKQKESYRRNPQSSSIRNHRYNISGMGKIMAAQRRERISNGYIARCLIQRGWNKNTIDLLRLNKDAWELVRTQILAVREMRKCQSMT